MKEQEPILYEGKPVADGDKPLRPKIVKVAKMVGGLSGMMNKIDANAPEYYSLAGSVSDEECDFILSLGLRRIRTDAYVAKKLGWDMDRVHRVGDHLGYLGTLRVDFFEQDGHYEYFCPIFAPGLLEIMVVSPNALEHPEIRRAFNQYTHDRLQNMGPMIPDGYGLMRVIPIERALPKDEKPDPRDTLSYYLDKYDYYSVGQCSCRVSRTQMGEGCGHMADDRCIKLGKAAKFFVRTGKDRAISREELETIMHNCEEEGLMHCIPNIESIRDGNTTAICDCCGCACFGLRPVEEFKTTDAVASNYRCVVEAANCVACGKCVEYCPTNAIKLGVKLNQKCETKVAFAKGLGNHGASAIRNPDYRFTRNDVIPETGTAPCKTYCPAHIGIQGYIKMASEGRYKEALALIKHENPFPAVCGRICNHPCELHCTRASVDQAIAIDDIKKAIAERELTPEGRFLPWKRHDYSDKKIAIIGGGPAGLSCAYYLLQDGYEVTVFEKEDKLGGMLTLGIPAFRLEKDVVEAEIDIIREMGCHFRTGVEVGKDITIPELRKQGFNGFFIAIGAQASRHLGLEGEDHPDILGGIDFLRAVNLGKGARFDGENVIVVGGGNVAMDVARTALRQGAAKIDLYCLESRDEMPSAKEELAEAEAEGIVIHNSYGPKVILRDGDKLNGITFRKCLSVRDAEGRFNPSFDDNDLIDAKASHILLAIGQSFDYGKLLEGTKVQLGRGNTILADPFTLQTTDPDIFAGGDVHRGARFAIEAIAEGKQAAISLHRYVQPGQLLDAGRNHREFKALDVENMELDGFDKAPRQIPQSRPIDVTSFKDNRGILTEEQIKKEAARCLSCGKAIVDPNMCVGCGQCVIKCQFDAAHLVKKSTIYAKDFDALLPRAVGHTIKRGIKIAAGALKKD